MRQGLLDSSHPSTKEWIHRIYQLDIGIDEELDNNVDLESAKVRDELRKGRKIRRGLKIEFETAGTQAKNPFILEVSSNNGKSFLEIPSLERKLTLQTSSSESVKNIYIKLTPLRNLDGKITLIFTPVLYDFTNKEERIQEFGQTKIEVKV